MLIQEGIHLLAMPVPSPLPQSLETLNCYLLTDGSDAYLVDTGLPGSGGWEMLLELMDAAGLAPAQLNGVVVTHAHPDHLGHLEAIQQLTGAPVLLHREEQAYQSSYSFDGDWDQTVRTWCSDHGVPATLADGMGVRPPHRRAPALHNPVWLEGGEVIPIGRMRWQVLWTPGHAPGHICLWEQVRGLLITGDHVLPRETPNVGVHPRMPDRSLGRYLESLRRVRGLGVTTALPGHSAPFANLDQVVEYILNHHDMRLQDVQAALRTGPADTYGVSCQVPWVQRTQRFPDLSPRDRFLALGETIAHLEYLADLGEVNRLDGLAPIRWQLAPKAAAG